MQKSKRIFKRHARMQREIEPPSPVGSVKHGRPSAQNIDFASSVSFSSGAIGRMTADADRSKMISAFMKSSNFVVSSCHIKDVKKLPHSVQVLNMMDDKVKIWKRDLSSRLFLYLRPTFT